MFPQFFQKNENAVKNSMAYYVQHRFKKNGGTCPFFFAVVSTITLHQYWEICTLPCRSKPMDCRRFRRRPHFLFVVSSLLSKSRCFSLCLFFSCISSSLVNLYFLFVLVVVRYAQSPFPNSVNSTELLFMYPRKNSIMIPGEILKKKKGVVEKNKQRTRTNFKKKQLIDQLGKHYL